jgi:hypothetical protein
MKLNTYVKRITKSVQFGKKDCEKKTEKVKIKSKK